MQLNPYLFFNGQCEEAFKFYEKTLGGKITAMMPHAGTPASEQVPAEWQNKILYAAMQIGDQLLMASDAPPGRSDKPQGFSVSVQVKDATEAERIFHALSDNATIHMPLQQTFWALRFGMLVDRFGTPWRLTVRKLSDIFRAYAKLPQPCCRS